MTIFGGRDMITCLCGENNSEFCAHCIFLYPPIIKNHNTASCRMAEAGSFSFQSRVSSRCTATGLQ